MGRTWAFLESLGHFLTAFKGLVQSNLLSVDLLRVHSSTGNMLTLKKAGNN